MSNDKLVKGTDYTIVGNTMIVHDGVKYIPNECFKDLVNKAEIYEIFLPNSLIYIGEEAFFNAGNIRKIVIPNNVKYIMSGAFSNCGIVELVIGENVIYIGEHAFSDNRLETVNNKSNCLKMIDIMAFSLNSRLNKFNINGRHNVLVEETAFNGTQVSFKTRDVSSYELDYLNSSMILDREILRVIGASLGSDNFNYDCVVEFDKYEVFDDEEGVYPSNGCWYGTPNKYKYENGVLKIKEGVEIVGSFAKLRDCTTIEMPDSVLMIQYDAFRNLSKLENIKFSKNLLIIESDAFNGCALRKESVKLPESLCDIDVTAFESNEGENKILLSNLCQTYNGDAQEDFNDIYELYSNSMIFDRNDKINSININELLESERETLKSLGLLPNIIEENTKLNNVYNPSQSGIVKNSLISFLNISQYDENVNINFVIKMLELKEVDIREAHVIISTLFVRKQIKTIYLFISYGYDYTNNSVISRAILNDLYEMIDVLLLIGADINEINTIDMSPLSIACKKGDANLVKHLIEKGAAINITDSKNKKAMDYAIENNHHNIVDLLNKYSDFEKDDTEKDIDTLKKILG